MLRGGWEVKEGKGGLLFRLRLFYIPNFSLLLSLESLEKCCGGGDVKTYFSVQLKPRPS